MKTFIRAASISFVTIIILCFQRNKLETLRQENHVLEASVRERVTGAGFHRSSDGYRHSPIAVDPSNASAQRLKTQVDLSFEMFLNSGWTTETHAEFEQIRYKMIHDLAGTDHLSAFDILKQSLDLHELSDDQRDRLIGSFVRIYTDANPVETLKLFGRLPDYPEFTKHLIKAYLRSAINKPGQALAWFEEQSRNGNPIAGNPEMIRASLTAQARVDPTRAVTGMSDLTDSHVVEDLGSVLAREFRNAAEHVAFSRALQHVFAKNATSSALTEIRKSYAKSLVLGLDDWPFEDAVLLIDGCLTPEERFEAARSLMFFEKDQEAGNWADWLASLDVPDNNAHPLQSFVGRWALSDPAAALNWLENNASGPAMELGTIGFANYMAERDPQNALRLLGGLAESEKRSNTIQRVRERWRKVDPAAEAGFNLNRVPEE